MVVAFHHSGAVFFSKGQSALMGLVTLPAKDLKKYSLGIGSHNKQADTTAIALIASGAGTHQPIICCVTVEHSDLVTA